MFYDRINKIPMKIPEFKRSGVGIFAESRRIPNGFPNQEVGDSNFWFQFLGPHWKQNSNSVFDSGYSNRFLFEFRC
jgi:hypothetical protein